MALIAAGGVAAGVDARGREDMASIAAGVAMSQSKFVHNGAMLVRNVLGPAMRAKTTGLFEDGLRESYTGQVADVQFIFESLSVT